MLASAQSATLLGVEGRPVRVEVHVSQGLPGFTVVGLPDTTCREARDRVRAALLSTGLTWPMCRVTVNLAPPGLRKVGAGLDLAIAGALLAASEQVPAGALVGRAFVGELGLDGSVRSVSGALPLIDALGAGEVVVPEGCTVEAQLVGRHVVRPVATLGAMVRALQGVDPWPDAPDPVPPPPSPPGPDLADVRGQPVARLRARGGGGRRAPPAARRPARLRQDDARPPPRRPASRPRPRRRPRRHLHPLGCRPAAAARRAHPPSAVPGPAPRRVGRVARGRRFAHAPAGRDQPRPPGRAVPRRAGRVRAQRARQPAPAARGGGHPGGSGDGQGRPSRPACCSWAP